MQVICFADNLFCATPILFCAIQKLKCATPILFCAIKKLTFATQRLFRAKLAKNVQFSLLVQALSIFHRRRLILRRCFFV